jgi:hypothetical protein
MGNAQRNGNLRSLVWATEEGFRQMGDALKERAEAAGLTPGSMPVFQHCGYPSVPGHQDAAHVTLARFACPETLGWK